MTEYDRIRSFIRDKDAVSALGAIEQLEQGQGRSPRSLVLKALCLQLSDNCSLEEVESVLGEALALDDEYVDAHIEMGWFQLVMLDDAETAKTSFAKAAVLIERLSHQVDRGQKACDDDLGRK